METTMTGVQRRKKILEMLGQSSTPLSGGALGRAVGVSRQVVVQDIALLRTEGHPVLATARGYVLEVPHQTERLFKMCHTTEQTREELNTIVDLGGEVLDVMVNHRIYGKVSAPLNIRSRRDVEAFVENIRTGRFAAFKRDIGLSFPSRGCRSGGDSRRDRGSAAGKGISGGLPVIRAGRGGKIGGKSKEMNF